MSSRRFNNGQGPGVWSSAFRRSGATVHPRPPEGGTPNGNAAFTLLELLVVIAIIGILAAVALPRIPKTDNTVSATRQLLDDIALARSLAMSTRSDVYMVFVGHAESRLITAAQTSPSGINLLGGQYKTYALYAERTVGDQPGRSNPRYLTPWKTLPQGTFIATNKFTRPPQKNHAANNDGVSAFEFTPIPFPQATNSPKTLLPCIIFTSRGQLMNPRDIKPRDDGGEIIPLARGSIFYPRNAGGQIASPFTADVAENPPGNSRRTNTTWNWVRIDGLTSRARVERQEIQ